MDTRLGRLAAGVILAGVFASVPAEADVAWTVPGWYLEASETGLDITLLSGPYTDEAACNAVKPADDKDYFYLCDYEASDPNGGS